MKKKATKKKPPRIGSGKNWRKRLEVVQSKVEKVLPPAKLKRAVAEERKRIYSVRLPYIEVEHCQVVGRDGKDLHQHTLSLLVADTLEADDFEMFFRMLRSFLYRASHETINEMMREDEGD